jgi:amphi-Trp domain-containing protein
MSDFEQSETQHVSRQEAAERLTDISRALGAGTSIEFTVGSERITIPIGDAVRLKRKLKLEENEVELELELSWSTVHVDSTVASTPGPLS